MTNLLCNSKNNRHVIQVSLNCYNKKEMNQITGQEKDTRLSQFSFSCSLYKHNLVRDHWYRLSPSHYLKPYLEYYLLSQYSLSPTLRKRAEISLRSQIYEFKMKNQLSASSNFIAAQGIAKNDYSGLKNLSSYKSNIVNAIRYPEYKEENITLIEQGKIGEVILESINLLSAKDSKSNPNLKAGLRGLMQADLKETAKQLAIEYILAD